MYVPIDPGYPHGPGDFGWGRNGLHDKQATVCLLFDFNRHYLNETWWENAYVLYPILDFIDNFNKPVFWFITAHSTLTSPARRL